jgi:hypothetical protein
LKKKRKKEKGETGQICPIGSAMPGFSQLLGAIKNCFSGQSLNFMHT